MKAGITYIRKELDGLYAEGEIESFIHLIFGHVKGYDRTQFILSQEEQLTLAERNQIIEITTKLKKNEPIQYVLGETEFYGLPFYCRPGVLIPRPETEELVQCIIQKEGGNNIRILDIGTGTGCIAIALKKHIPKADVFACDVSDECLDLAKRNAIRNKAEVKFFRCDVLDNELGEDLSSCDVIVSNPPYVTRKEMKLMDKNVLNYEPDLALFVPDNKPLLFYEKIADLALDLLSEKGTLYFEINEAFGKECSSMLRTKGFLNVQIRKDINGKDRMVCGHS